ncbi:MAG: hypothetical protein RIT04_55 [Candidatus Parcubacteria bacterium]|jgi:chromosome segregation ATPase
MEKEPLYFTEFKNFLLTKFDNIDKRFDSLEKHLESLEKRLNVLEVRLNSLETEMNRRFEVLKTEIDQRFSVLETEMNRRFDVLKTEMDYRFDSHEEQIAKVSEQITALDIRLRKKADQSEHDNLKNTVTGLKRRFV